jgi:hypothetical protein
LQRKRSQNLRTLLPALFIFVLTNPAYAGLDEVVVQASELPKGWAFVRSYYSVSLRASDFYENYKTTYQPKAQGNLVAKKFQSFAGPARGTVFFLQFVDAADAGRNEEFAKNLVWAGAPGPTSEHPERIFTIGDTLVIISFSHQGMAAELERLIRTKNVRD